MPKEWNQETSSYISKLSNLSKHLWDFVLSLWIVTDKGNLLKDFLNWYGMEFLVELWDCAPIEFDVPEVLSKYPWYEKGKGFDEWVFVIKLSLLYSPKDIQDFKKEYAELEFSSIWAKTHKYFSKFIHKELLEVFMENPFVWEHTAFKIALFVTWISEKE